MKTATKIAVVLSVAILSMASCSSFYVAHSTNDEDIFVPSPSTIIEMTNQRYKKNLCREIPELHQYMKGEWPTQDFHDTLCWKTYYADAVLHWEAMQKEVLRQQTK